MEKYAQVVALLIERLQLDSSVELQLELCRPRFFLADKNLLQYGNNYDRHVSLMRLDNVAIRLDLEGFRVTIELTTVKYGWNYSLLRAEWDPTSRIAIVGFSSESNRPFACYKLIEKLGPELLECVDQFLLPNHRQASIEAVHRFQETIKSWFSS